MKSFFLIGDIIVQAVLLALCLFFPLTLFVAGPLGAWQLGSSFLKAIFLRSRLHLVYFGSALAYCQFLYIGVNHPEVLNIWELDIREDLWLVAFLPAIVGAIWYFRQSLKDGRNSTLNKEIV